MENHRPWTTALLPLLLAVLVTQPGCQRSSPTTGTDTTAPTADEPLVSRESLPSVESVEPSSDSTETESLPAVADEAVDPPTVEVNVSDEPVAENTISTPDESDVDTDDAVSMFPTPKSAPPSGDEFDKPIRIKAGDDFVSVESPGYACPTMADVDGDGKDDLVVGQFRDGNMQFCRNTAEVGQPPKFAAADWIKTGDQRAVVPGVW